MTAVLLKMSDEPNIVCEHLYVNRECTALNVSDIYLYLSPDIHGGGGCLSIDL